MSRVLKDQVRPLPDDPEIGFHCNMFGNAQLAIKPVAGNVKVDQVTGLEMDPPPREAPLNDRRFWPFCWIV